jgi:molybdenum cofactor synthesis domain-containing protein
MLSFGIITVSDRSYAGLRPDLSGPALVAAVEHLGWQVRFTKIVPDNLEIIQSTLLEAVSSQVDIILTTGGTGFSPRDITPEATTGILERLAPGLAEGMRAESLKKTPHAMLSRGVCGIRGSTLILNLPGSPKAAVENFQVIMPVLAHAVELLTNNPEAEQGHQ